MKWNEEVFQKMAEFASRAPSVHNVQPWRICYNIDGFEIYQSKNRRLHVGDPKLHDNDVSLGCFFELCSIFLKKEGFTLISDPLSSNVIKDETDTFEPRFKITLEPSIPFEDSLYQYVSKRKSYRGIFSNEPIEIDALNAIHIPGLEIKLIL